MERTVLPFAANCSMLFTEFPLLRRPEAARAAGFTNIEFWWPWPDTAVPTDSEVEAFVQAVRDAGVNLIGLNFFAGDLAGPDCGVLSLPFRSRQFTDNVAVTLGIGEQLGVRYFNALYGNRLPEASPEQQDDLAAMNLMMAATAARSIGATVLVEPVSGPKPYPLRTAADVIAVLDRVGEPNLGFLCDLFHLASNHDDLDAVIEDHVSRIAHVQVADAPGRGEPGSGKLDLKGYLTRLEGAGYTGWVSYEYKPTTGDTAASLSWLHDNARGCSPAI